MMMMEMTCRVTYFTENSHYGHTSYRPTWQAWRDGSIIPVVGGPVGAGHACVKQSASHTRAKLHVHVSLEVESLFLALLLREKRLSASVGFAPDISDVSPGPYLKDSLRTKMKSLSLSWSLRKSPCPCPGH